MTAIRPTPGSKLLLAGIPYVVIEFDDFAGCVRLADPDGVEQAMSIEELAHHPALEHINRGQLPSLGLVEGISAEQLEIALLRLGHCLEYETGFRSGDPARPLPGEPRRQYNPAWTNLSQRLEAKANELDNEFAARSGEKMQTSTIRLTLRKYRGANNSIEAIIDKRQLRRSNGRHSICPEVEEALWEVYAQVKQGSNWTYETIRLKTMERMANKYGNGAIRLVPSRQTITRFLDSHMTRSQVNGKSRTRRSAVEAEPGGFINANPTRPGELVLIDTQKLDVLLKGTVWENWVSGSLILGVDWFSRGIGSIRVVEKSETSLDVAMAVKDLARPRQMHPDWPDDLRWPFLGIPESLVAGSHGGAIAGLPVFAPEALVPDHGNTYKSYRNAETARSVGMSILPARKFRGADKGPVERWFRAFNTMLAQHLQGYRGSDVSERGANVEDDVRWTAQELEDQIALWVVAIWQRHPMKGVRPPNVPEGEWCPNELYEYGIRSSGLAPRLMSTNDYYDTLGTVFCVVRSRGVQVRDLWYDDRHGTLDHLRGETSKRGGAHKGKWQVKYDDRDLRHVYFLNESDTYVRLPWNGLTQHTPAFTDRHLTRLLQIRKQRGISARDHKALAEILVTEVLPQGDAAPHSAEGNAQSRTEANLRKMRLDQKNAGIEVPDSDHETHQDETYSPQIAARETRRARREATPDGKVPGHLGSHRSNVFGDLPHTQTDERHSRVS